MILGDRVLSVLAQKINLISPFDLNNLQPASYDLTLSNHFLMPEEGKVHNVKEKLEYISYFKDELVLEPKTFCLAASIEEVKLPLDLAARVEGRSSLGRIGMSIHVTAGFIDPGFNGRITFELFNCSNNSIKLFSGMRIAQICFFKVVGCCRGYSGKYQCQDGAVGSRLEYDFK